MERDPTAAVGRRTRRADGGFEEVYALPSDADFLERLLRDLFANHWSEIIFGPVIEGAAFEIACPGPPKSISLYDGYLTVHFGRTHFHLCIGIHRGSEQQPASAALSRHRECARAELARGLDQNDDPVTWSLRLFNGQGEQQMTLFFPNPFLTDDDQIAENPDFTRLALWHKVTAAYLGLDPDPRDRAGKGFGPCS